MSANDLETSGRLEDLSAKEVKVLGWSELGLSAVAALTSGLIGQKALEAFTDKAAEHGGVIIPTVTAIGAGAGAIYLMVRGIMDVDQAQMMQQQEALEEVMAPRGRVV